jgi:hypothetical protein
MKINTALLLLASLVLLSSCAAVPPSSVQQQPAPKPHYLPPKSQQTPRPVASMTSPGPADWRDAPQSPGAWSYLQEVSGSAARFGEGLAAPLLVLRCDRTRQALLIQRPSLGSGMRPITITTSSRAQQLIAAPVSGSPVAQNGPILFEVALSPSDPLLDSMAFSRGRFVVEMNGATQLVLPAWAEVGRVIEDCRKH